MSFQNPPESGDNEYGWKDEAPLSQDWDHCRSQLAASVQVGNSFRLKRNSGNLAKYSNVDEYSEPSDTSSENSYKRFRLSEEDIGRIAEVTASKVCYKMIAHALKLHTKKLRWLKKF